MQKMKIFLNCVLFMCIFTSILEFNAAVKVTTGINTNESLLSNVTVKPRVKKRTGKIKKFFFAHRSLSSF